MNFLLTCNIDKEIKIAKSMLKDNTSISFIAKHTGLDESTIIELQEEMKDSLILTDSLRYLIPQTIRNADATGSNPAALTKEKPRKFKGL